MGLASALSTALTGLTAAETTIDVVGNNLANSNTVGFKASEASFATQFLQTQSLGSKPTDASGGTNPNQTGLGTMVADITPDFGQGTVEVSSNPMDMAIQGDGFFIVQGNSGEQLYTRNGVFRLNGDNEVTTITGNRVMGYGVDDQFQIQTTQLVPLEIRLGGSQVAEATQNVYLEGTLTPSGEVADTASIIKTGVLGDASYSQPPAPGAAPAASEEPGDTTSRVTADGGAMAPGTYYYKVVYGDGSTPPYLGTEGIASQTFSATVAAGDTAIDLSGLPADASGYYKTWRIYRSELGDTTGPFYFVGEAAIPEPPAPGDPPLPPVHFVDGTSDANLILNGTLNTDTLNGNYTYYVTFVNSSGVESRPSPAITKLIQDGRIQLRDLPVQGSGDQWISRRIYRNTVDNPTEYYLLATVPNDVTTADICFTDNVQDADIEDLKTLDFNGPKIFGNTLVTDVVSRDGSNYQTLFKEGTLQFAPKKGDRTLAMKEFEITDETTVQELVDFMQDAMGIRESPGPDLENPIPVDGPTGDIPGGRVDPTTGQIIFVGNNGADNGLEISLSSMKIIEPGIVGGESVNMPFSTTQVAAGQSAVSDLIAYDSLGMSVQVRLTVAMEARDNTNTTYRWYADCPDNQNGVDSKIACGTGLIMFDGEGNFTSATEETVSIYRRDVPSTSPLEFELDFSEISGLAADEATLAVTRQDGSGPGTLTSFIVGEDGTIRGVFSNGITRDLGQIRLARFGNPAGLEQRGENLYSTGVNSGLPVEGNPGEQGIGSIIAGATELSNTDIGKNLIDLILASTMYRGNTRVITTSQEMLDELLALRR
ncbi:MAG: flagellar hook-basal body complex protein [Planctomycetia bacterium]|nr:flagellar hook-basal body complex protein [Planctomycetia bacterium]